MIMAMLLIARCALVLAVLGLLVLPFSLGSPVSLAVDLLGICLNLFLIALSQLVLRRIIQRGVAAD